MWSFSKKIIDVFGGIFVETEIIENFCRYIHVSLDFSVVGFQLVLYYYVPPMLSTCFAH